MLLDKYIFHKIAGTLPYPPLRIGLAAKQHPSQRLSLLPGSASSRSQCVKTRHRRRSPNLVSSSCSRVPGDGRAKVDTITASSGWMCAASTGRNSGMQVAHSGHRQRSLWHSSPFLAAIALRTAVGRCEDMYAASRSDKVLEEV